MKFNIVLNRVELIILCSTVHLIGQAQVKPVVKPYKVKNDLRNVVNLEYFSEAIGYRIREEFTFSDEQKEKLVQNGFVAGLQFRFMGQRFMPDSYIIQKLVYWPEKPWPKGLDVMAVLGSRQAVGRLVGC